MTMSMQSIWNNESIEVYKRQTVYSCMWHNTPRRHQSIFTPQGIDKDNSVHVYVTDKGNDCVEVFVVGAGLTNDPSMARQLQLTHDYEYDRNQLGLSQGMILDFSPTALVA